MTLHSVSAPAVPSLLKLTLRDLLWLALLIGGLTAWGIQHQRSSRQAQQLKKTSFVRLPGAGPGPAALQRQAAVEKFAACSDAELDQRFAAAAASAQWQHAADYEPCLAEMVRRKMVDQLQKHYDALMARSDSERGFPYNLELLTALRRAQGQPDPLRIEIALADPSKTGLDPQAPAAQATITNVDAGRQSVHFTRGGDYRGGRRERWRAILTDQQGRVVRDSNYVSLMGGGIASIGPFAFGETDADGHSFDLRRYVAPSRSGKYQLQFVYHNELDLAVEPDMTGLIVTKSQPLEVLIHVPAKGNGLDPGTQALIAILAAAAVLTLATVIGNRRHSQRSVIYRRDIAWNCLLIVVALGVWLDDRYWIARIASLTPDANASWSIALDTPAERTRS